MFRAEATTPETSSVAGPIVSLPLDAPRLAALVMSSVPPERTVPPL